MPRIDYISTLGDVIIKFNATMDVDTALIPIEEDSRRRISQVRSLQSEENLFDSEENTSAYIVFKGEPTNSEKFVNLQNTTIRINETEYPSVKVEVKAFDPDDYCFE